jgi:hypothetical protein
MMILFKSTVPIRTGYKSHFVRVTWKVNLLFILLKLREGKFTLYTIKVTGREEEYRRGGGSGEIGEKEEVKGERRRRRERRGDAGGEG